MVGGKSLTKIGGVEFRTLHVSKLAYSMSESRHIHMSFSLLPAHIILLQLEG